MAWKVFKWIDNAADWVREKVQSGKDENQYFVGGDDNDGLNDPLSNGSNSWNEGENNEVAKFTHDEDLMIWVAQYSLTETIKYFFGQGPGNKPPPQSLENLFKTYGPLVIVVVVVILIIYIID